MKDPRALAPDPMPTAPRWRALGTTSDPSADEPVTFSGLLVVDTPAGVTSHDVVLKVRRRLKSPGAGHLGTLDPGASGLLAIALGAATRAIPVWQGGLKTYEARLRFGVITSTQDLHGEVLERRAVELTEEVVRKAAEGFVGELEQTPPMVSALKVGGRRLHALARRGIEVDRRARPIRVHTWEWLGFDLPEATFRIQCSAGTYVRTLAHDLGQRLGTGAALAALRRLRSEPFDLASAVRLRDLDQQPPSEVLAHAIPLGTALAVLPAVRLDRRQVEAIGVGGRPLVEPGDAPIGAGPRSVVFRADDDTPLALGELRPDADPARALACPHVVFPWAVRSGRPQDLG
jgi:tRNA pseudouridine55 synthase